MEIRSRAHTAAIVPALALAGLIGASTVAFATDSTKPTPEKWRPKDGLYIRADAEFTGPCEDAAPFLFELSKKRFVVEERWGCKITKIVDTAPGAVRLNMTCDESEIAGDDDGKNYKEVMALRRIGDTSFYMQLTNKGKSNGPPWRVNYCERILEENNKAEVEQKEAARKTAWQPRDGVYANAGADFDDRCMKSGDVVVWLAQSSLSIGGSSCYVAHVAIEPPNSASFDVSCGRLVKSGSTFEIVSGETVALSKIDDQSVLLHRSHNGQAVGSDQELRYCPDAAQRAYADSKKVK